MRPIRLTLTIELPPAGTPERDELDRTTLAELLGVHPGRSSADPDPTPRASIDPSRAGGVRPHRPEPDDDEPADVQSDAPAPKMMADEIDGSGLYGLCKDHSDGMVKEAQRISKSKGFSWKLSELDKKQATAVLRTLLASHPELRDIRRARA